MMWLRALAGLIAILQVLYPVEAEMNLDLKSLTPELMKPIFDTMRYYGEQERDKVNEEIKKNNKGKPKKERERTYRQYLVVTVVSVKDIQEAHSWKGTFPTHFTQKSENSMRRLAFLLNDRNHGLPLYNPDRELHGEVQAMDLGYIEKMMSNYKEDNVNDPKYPLVLMYSHYIPCAHVPGLGYSCAEELKNHARDRLDQFALLVAYTECFPKTDEQASLTFMKEGGVIAFKNMIEYYDRTVFVYPPNTINDEAGPFQQEFFQCLMDLPVSHCCTGQRKEIVTFFVNGLTYKCTFKSLSRGYLTEKSRNELKTCIKQEVEQRVGDDCIDCSKKSPEQLQATKVIIKFCLELSLDNTNRLGKAGNSPYEPNWQPYTGAFKNLYNVQPTKAAKGMHRVACLNQHNSLESMCLATEKSNDNERAKKLIKILYQDNKYAHLLPQKP